MSGAAAAWSELVRAALLGTERQPPPAAGEDGSPLTGVLARAGGETPEARLLRAAALAAPYRRAGRLPPCDHRPLPAPSEGDGASLCPPMAARHLAAMLAGAHREALPEWLAAAARGGWTVPPEQLPALLEAARARGELREHLPAVLGARGRWLAARRPEWAALGTDAEDGAEGGGAAGAWETGAAAPRVELLKRLRGRDPARGRALLEGTWAAEPARERAAFLAALEAGLGPDDEPFLERALDDRGKEARAAAARLLARLDGSRLVGRMTERALAWVRVAPPKTGLVARVTGGSSPSFAVDLPAECDRAMVRDGVDPGRIFGLGERAWWLCQVVAAVPPRVWSAAAGAPPERCIAGVRGHELEGLLLPAWAAAAVRQRDADWAEALVPAWERWQGAAGGVLGATVPALASVLPPERAEATALRLLEPRGEVWPGDAAAQVLAGTPGPWSRELTRAVLRRIPRTEGGLHWKHHELLHDLAARMEPAAALDEAAAGEMPQGRWSDLLHHRHAMLEALETMPEANQP